MAADPARDTVRPLTLWTHRAQEGMTGTARAIFGRVSLAGFTSILGMASSDVPPPASATPPPTPRPPSDVARRARREGNLIIVMVLVVAFAIVAGVASVAWLASTLRPPTSPCTFCPKGLGVAVAQSPDGTNWTLVFTSVPSGLTPSNTYLALHATNGTAIMTGMPLSAMTGGLVMMQGGAGQLYMRYEGVVSGVLSGSDAVQIGTIFAGTSTSTMGCGVEISSSGSVLYQGTLA